MNIIFISNKSERARKISLTGKHITLFIGVFLLIVLMFALSLNFVSLRYADRIQDPFLRALLVNPQEERHQKIQTHLQDNLNIMASKLGQMQAHLLRLDALGERLAESTGIESRDLLFNELPGQGGAHSAFSSEALTFAYFSHKLHELSDEL